MPKVDAPEAFGHAQSVAKRVTLIAVQPIPIIKAVGLDHQRVSLPLAYRISQPSWLRILGKRTAIDKDLAECIGSLVENRHESRHLEDLEGMVGHVDSGHGRGHAMRVGIVLAILLLAAFCQSRRPRLNGKVRRLEVGGEVLKCPAVGGLVDPGKIRSAVRRSRCGRREIRLTVGGARNSRCRVSQPLGVETCREER